VEASLSRRAYRKGFAALAAAGFLAYLFDSISDKTSGIGQAPWPSMEEQMLGGWGRL
jgi:hypothetical protein